MFRTFNLGRLFGVEIRVHSTLLLLTLAVGFMSLLSGGVATAVGAVVTLGFLFSSVTLHELGHIGAARAFGIGTTGVTLYPFGGVARLSRESRTATEEVVVALAGPAVNVALAALAAIPMAFLGPVSLLSQFMWVNIVLAIFNLVPAYPMDGGRVLRGLLWKRLGLHDATRWAAKAGQAFAVLFGLVGLVYSPMLMVIAVFVFMQASAELARLKLQRFYGPPTQSAPQEKQAPGGPIHPEVFTQDGRPLRPWGPTQGPRPRAPRQVVFTFGDPWERR